MELNKLMTTFAMVMATAIPSLAIGDSHPAATAKWALTGTGVRVTCGEKVRTLAFYGGNALRVKTDLGSDFWRHPSLVVTARPDAPAFTAVEKDGRLVVTGPAFTATVDLKTGAVTFADGGKTLLAEAAEPVSLRQYEVEGDPTYEAVQRWRLAADEGLYGLGQAASENPSPAGGAEFPSPNLRGQRVGIMQANVPAYASSWSSTKGYMIVWDVYSKTDFDATGDQLVLTGESAPGGSDYYFLYGRDPDARFAAYRDLTGATPMFSKSCLGYFQSKERYVSEQDLTYVIEHCRAAGFPIDWVVQDWKYWPGDSFKGYWNGMAWDKGRFPDVKAMCDRFHGKYHVKLLVSVWPHVGDNTEVGRELAAEGLLSPVALQWVSHARAYDASSPRAREIYMRHVRREFFDKGVDGLWMDATEPESYSDSHDGEAIRRGQKAWKRIWLGDTTRYCNTYVLSTAEAAYEAQRAISDRRVFTLTRSSWTGLQRYAAISWSGDTTASWERLRNDIGAGLDSSMSGLAWWTQDTGGFFPGRYKEGIGDPAYRELLARWNQFAIFNPVYRWHGTRAAAKKEPWIQDRKYPESFKSYLDAAKIRYRLLPYLYSLARETHETGRPFVRPVWLDYPETPGAVGATDELCLGKSVYAGFIVQPGGGTNRTVRLPTGADWYGWWDGGFAKGGETVRKEWPIDRFPLYVKAGTILPLAPFKLWADQPTDEPDEIRVYAGGDAAFTLYDDDHETYAYERGEYVKIPLVWNDAAKTLTIGAAEGAYPGMPSVRKFKVTLVTPQGTRVLATTVDYAGAEISVKGK